MIQVIINGQDETELQAVHKIIFDALNTNNVLAHLAVIKTPFTMVYTPPAPPVTAPKSRKIKAKAKIKNKKVVKKKMAKKKKK